MRKVVSTNYNVFCEAAGKTVHWRVSIKKTADMSELHTDGVWIDVTDYLEMDTPEAFGNRTEVSDGKVQSDQIKLVGLDIVWWRANIFNYANQLEIKIDFWLNDLTADTITIFSGWIDKLKDVFVVKLDERKNTIEFTANGYLEFVERLSGTRMCCKFTNGDVDGSGTAGIWLSKIPGVYVIDANVSGYVLKKGIHTITYDYNGASPHAKLDTGEWVALSGSSGTTELINEAGDQKVEVYSISTSLAQDLSEIEQKIIVLTAGETLPNTWYNYQYVFHILKKLFELAGITTYSFDDFRITTRDGRLTVSFYEIPPGGDTYIGKPRCILWDETNQRLWMGIGTHVYYRNMTTHVYTDIGEVYSGYEIVRLYRISSGEIWGIAINASGATKAFYVAIANENYNLELVTNGGFDSSAGWTTEAGWSIGSGVASHIGAWETMRQTQPIFMTGKTYRVQFDFSGDGFCIVCIGYGGGYVVASTGHNDIIEIADGGDLVFAAEGGSIIDNVSVVEVPESYTLTNRGTADTPENGARNIAYAASVGANGSLMYCNSSSINYKYAFDLSAHTETEISNGSPSRFNSAGWSNGGDYWFLDTSKLLRRVYYSGGSWHEATMAGGSAIISEGTDALYNTAENITIISDQFAAHVQSYNHASDVLSEISSGNSISDLTYYDGKIYGIVWDGVDTLPGYISSGAITLISGDYLHSSEVIRSQFGHEMPHNCFVYNPTGNCYYGLTDPIQLLYTYDSKITMFVEDEIDGENKTLIDILKEVCTGFNLRPRVTTQKQCHILRRANDAGKIITSGQSIELNADRAKDLTEECGLEGGADIVSVSNKTDSTNYDGTEYDVTALDGEIIKPVSSNFIPTRLLKDYAFIYYQYFKHILTRFTVPTPLIPFLQYEPFDGATLNFSGKINTLVASVPKGGIIVGQTISRNGSTDFEVITIPEL